MLPDLRPPPPRPSSAPREVAVLGSTGSIGRQTLEVAALFPERVRVRSLAAGAGWEALAEQARRVRPARAVIADEGAYVPLRDALAGTGVEVAAGDDAVAALAADAEVVVAAVVGVAGLASTLAAARAGARVALANKESLVVGGALVAAACAESGAVVVPVDSEHSALFQCLVGEDPASVERLLLTASGGPFRDRPARTFDAITPAEALRHPNWSMGAKVTVDSATMMNKGLEVIEAHWLFGVEPERIGVVVHPQSVVHSVVEFVDGSSKAQLGVPDMKVPIQVALSYPERWPAPHERLDWPAAGPLDFVAPDPERFPCLTLAYDALRAGGAAPAALNAANEVAVARFLDGAVRFTDVPRLVEAGMRAADAAGGAGTLGALRAVDAEARRLAAEAARSLQPA
ncbi:1-deoxy-D-xylulose-5-phosphate reductoisomerase [Rubrivirga sp. S365]|uniref:1-deoxy-D-xylulose 5-phosphate reductoisomerase n=1 Tax=Rubrivirga litoralis TaxID=3075598 RepID=A0ABU3BQN1_9BACT|nr:MULTISPECIES: 1-deoxy-D-xylulose-5-phosphate reductoisomerase [unclassified Rubrivirga]MDT0631593.1 1-deoxy-D-xylulose-5-phosphate reductoisomerase [Rubrivirga sp. F394]MDT7857238.1 1-deoxy-D-xylulose-5-phosphate reductoisomerase [Rubrivirga sp. S365]